MADPKNKYSGLPGIAPPDEKDVYETDDLPEADQSDFLDEPESENIERPHLNVRSAHERFRGKTLIPSRNLDFSDAARRRRHIGYDAINGEWEIAIEGEPETIEQRRHRLEAEFRLLIEDINQLKAEGKEKQNAASVLAETLVPELESTLRQLSQVQIPDCSGDLTVASSQHVMNIQNMVNQLGPKQTSKTEKGSKPHPLVTYQFSMFPAQAQLGKSARLSDLELRLKQLDTVLGASPENLNRLGMSDFKNLTEAVSELSARSNALDLTKIDAMDAKLGNLVNKMDAVVEKRGGPQQVEFEAKVNELYDSYRKVEALGQTLLPLADRLVALSDLHEQAGEFKTTLAQLKVEISNISTKMATDEAVLDGIRTGIQDLAQNVTTNISNFNTRLAAVQK